MIYRTILAFFATTMLLILSSCSAEESLQKERSEDWTEEKIKSSLKFLNRYSIPTTKRVENRSDYDTDFHADNNIGITIRLGRKSKSCGGFGLCHLVRRDHFPGDRYIRAKYPMSKRIVGIVNTIIENDNNNYFSLLLLEEKPNPDIPTKLLNLEIEEELILPLKNGDLYIYPGVIPFDPSLGKCGGYRISLHKESSL